MSQEEIGVDLDAGKYTPEQFAAFKKEFPDVDTRTLARFLIARNGDISKSTPLLRDNLKWRKENLPALKATCMTELKTGKTYVRGFDKKGHPLIIFHTYLHDPNDRCIKELIRLACFTFETAIKKLPSENSKVTVLINRVGASSGSDIEFARLLIGIL